MNMINMLLFLFGCCPLMAAPRPAADISYMVADLKYSRKNGVKICEIQHGFHSAFDEDVYLHGNLGLISPLAAHFFNRFSIRKWASGVLFSPLALALSSQGWTINKSAPTLFKDEEFLTLATRAAKDFSSIASYSAIHYCSQMLAKNSKELLLKYPGILFIDAGTMSYWNDKYKMTSLFASHPALKEIKPEWGLYPCQYKKELASLIMQDIPSLFYVIKPRQEMKGKGVLIISHEDLDMTLNMIFGPSENRHNPPDSAYAYWQKNQQETFIVEKFYPSDPLVIPKIGVKTPPIRDGKEEWVTYDPTLRIAFILLYDKGEIECTFLGGYWRLPRKSMEEGGTLHELKKEHQSIYYASRADQHILLGVFEQLKEKIPLLYKAMLGLSLDD
ncbi:MAG: hypothetical protein ACH350_02860 [Parachlamydiaceae bacterium]